MKKQNGISIAEEKKKRRIAKEKNIFVAMNNNNKIPPSMLYGIHSHNQNKIFAFELIIREFSYNAYQNGAIHIKLLSMKEETASHLYLACILSDARPWPSLEAQMNSHYLCSGTSGRHGCGGSLSPLLACKNISDYQLHYISNINDPEKTIHTISTIVDNEIIVTQAPAEMTKSMLERLGSAKQNMNNMYAFAYERRQENVNFMNFCEHRVVQNLMHFIGGDVAKYVKFDFYSECCIEQHEDFDSLNTYRKQHIQSINRKEKFDDNHKDSSFVFDNIDVELEIENKKYRLKVNLNLDCYAGVRPHDKQGLLRYALTPVRNKIDSPVAQANQFDAKCDNTFVKISGMAEIQEGFERFKYDPVYQGRLADYIGTTLGLSLWNNSETYEIDKDSEWNYLAENWDKKSILKRQPFAFITFDITKIESFDSNNNPIKPNFYSVGKDLGELNELWITSNNTVIKNIVLESCDNLAKSKNPDHIKNLNEAKERLKILFPSNQDEIQGIDVLAQGDRKVISVVQPGTNKIISKIKPKLHQEVTIDVDLIYNGTKIDNTDEFKNIIFLDRRNEELGFSTIRWIEAKKCWRITISPLKYCENNIWYDAESEEQILEHNMFNTLPNRDIRCKDIYNLIYFLNLQVVLPKRPISITHKDKENKINGDGIKECKEFMINFEPECAKIKFVGGKLFLQKQNPDIKRCFTKGVLGKSLCQKIYNDIYKFCERWTKNQNEIAEFNKFSKKSHSGGKNYPEVWNDDLGHYLLNDYVDAAYFDQKEFNAKNQKAKEQIEKRK